MDPNKPKKKGASFWVAFRESKNGTAKKKVTNKLTGEVFIQTGFWFVLYRDKYGRTITDGKGGYDTKPLAKAGLHEFRKTVANGTAQEVTEKIEEDGKRAIPALIQEFLPIKATSVCKGTMTVYKTKLPKLMKYLDFIKRPLLKIDEFLCKNAWDFKDYLIMQGHNNGGVSGHIRVAKHFFFWCKDKGYYNTNNPFCIKNSSNQAILSKDVLPSTHIPRYLSEKDLQILFDACRMFIGFGNCHKSKRTIVVNESWAGENKRKQNVLRTRNDLLEIMKVALYTGMREGEIVNLKREWVHGDIKNNDARIIVPERDLNFQPKGRKARSIPTNTLDIWPILTKVESGYIWKGWDDKKEKWNEQRVLTAFGRLVDRAKKYFGFAGDVTFHDFRHTFAMLFLLNGGTLDQLQDILGHSSIVTTQIYRHWVNSKAQSEVINRIKINTSPLLEVVK